MAMVPEEVFRERIRKSQGDEYSLVRGYRGVNYKATFVHNRCGTEFEAKADNVVTKLTNCPKCRVDHRTKKRYTQDEIDRKFKDVGGEDYEAIGEYEGVKMPIQVRHNKCGYEFETTPDNFIHSNKRCPKCSYKCGPTDELFKERVRDLVGAEYAFLEEFESVNGKIPVTHNVCGYIFETTPARFIITGKRCPKCAGNAKLTNEDFLQRVRSQAGDEYTFLEEYRGIDTKIKVRHEHCGYEYPVTPYKFLVGRRCPSCRSSKGEEAVRRVLEDAKVDYEREKMIGGVLRADFYLPEFRAFIEYDGIQHFEPVPYFGGEEKFKESQRRDEVKNWYSHYTSMPILRIPYTDYDNIEEMVYRFVEGLSKEEK